MSEREEERLYRALREELRPQEEALAQVIGEEALKLMTLDLVRIALQVQERLVRAIREPYREALRRQGDALAQVLNWWQMMGIEAPTATHANVQNPLHLYPLGEESLTLELEDLIRIALQVTEGQRLLSEEDTCILQYLANSRVEEIRVGPLVDQNGTRRTHAAVRLTNQVISVGVARGICAVLAGEVRLLRCPAPEPGHSDPARKCGKYFVSGGKVGRPAQFCCEACAKRDSRVRKKVRERGGCEET